MVVDSLLQSAELYLRRGAYREAVDDYRAASVLKGSRLEPEQEGAQARALELSGQPAAGRRVRANALAVALLWPDHGPALRIATSGLPESEPVDGDQTVVRALDEIDEDRLSADDRIQLHCHRSRQLTINGHPSRAKEAADRAVAEATTPRQRLQAALALRSAIDASSSALDRLAVLDTVADVIPALEPRLQADHLFLRALDHYAAGHLEEAHHWRSELDRLGDGVSAQRRWHLRLFDAMTITDEGRRQDARKHRRVALEFALKGGLTEGLTAWGLGYLIDGWLTGDLSPYAGELEPGELLEPGQGAVLTRACATIVLDAMGRSDEAEREAVALVRDIEHSPVSQRVGALALVASVLARTGEHRPDRAGCAPCSKARESHS